GSSNKEVGVMIRENLSSSSRYGFSGNLADQQTRVFQTRQNPGSNATHMDLPNSPIPDWYKLVRQGNTFTAFGSTDGSNWVAIGNPQNVGVTTSALAGLAVSSGTDTSATVASFDRLVLASGPDFYVVPTPVTSTVVQGAGTSYALNINSLNGYT